MQHFSVAAMVVENPHSLKAVNSHRSGYMQEGHADKNSVEPRRIHIHKTVMPIRIHIHLTGRKIFADLIKIIIFFLCICFDIDVFQKSVL